MKEPEMELDLIALMRQLYASEINCIIATLYDRGWLVCLGDEINGPMAEQTFGIDELGRAARWMAEAACEAYPNSDFARRHSTPKLVS
jgi:hypothetical protein